MISTFHLPASSFDLIRLALADSMIDLSILSNSRSAAYIRSKNFFP